MRFAQKSRLGRFLAAVGCAVAAWWACVLAIAADRPPVREKIQFSSPGNPTDSPTARPRDDLVSRPFEFLDRDNSISGVVEPLVAPATGALPNTARNARLIEAFDRKKNWVYVRSEDLNRTRTMEETFGLRDAAGGDRKPRTALENFFEDRGQKPLRDRTRETAGEWKGTGAKQDTSGFDRDDRTGANAIVHFDSPFDTKRTLAAGFSLPGDFWRTAPGPGRLDNFDNGGLGDSFSSERDRQNRSDEFRKLLSVPGSLNPLVPRFDPINLQVDMTRQVLNPVTAQRLGELPGVGGDFLNPLRSGEPLGNRSALFDIQSVGSLGPSSLSPAVTAPTGPSYVPLKPAQSEFPRRKF